MTKRKVKPVRISPTSLDAPEKVVLKVTDYRFFEGTTREGREYSVDLVCGELNGYPTEIGLNDSSLKYLHEHGINTATYDTEELKEALVGLTLTFELSKKGKYPAYYVTRVRAK